MNKDFIERTRSADLQEKFTCKQSVLIICYSFQTFQIKCSYTVKQNVFTSVHIFSEEFQINVLDMPWALWMTHSTQTEQKSPKSHLD